MESINLNWMKGTELIIIYAVCFTAAWLKGKRDAKKEETR